MTKTDAEWQAWQHDWDGPVLSSRAIRCLMKARITSRSQLRDALVNNPNLLRWTPGMGNVTLMELYAAMQLPPPRKVW